jgi:hypothetical protein
MSMLLGNILVGFAVAASLTYAVLSLGPRAWRRAIRSALGFKSAAANASTGSCGGCDGCGSEPASQSPSAEIKIPVTRIGRR